MPKIEKYYDYNVYVLIKELLLVLTFCKIYIKLQHSLRTTQRARKFKKLQAKKLVKSNIAKNFFS